jgi:hypothetical protein
MSLLAKKSFSKCHSQVPHHRAVLFRIPRKWIDQDKVDMLLSSTSLTKQNIPGDSEGNLHSDNSPAHNYTVLPRISKGAGCVGSPVRQKKDENPAAYIHFRSSASSYDILNVCENCFKIYGALHNIKKHQESQKKQLGINVVDLNLASSTTSSNPKLMSPSVTNISSSSSMTPEQKKAETSTVAAGPSDAGVRFASSPTTDIAKTTSPTPSSPNQNVVKSTSPLNRSMTRRKGMLGASIQSESSEAGELPTIDMEWRIKNFSQKQLAGKFAAEPHGIQEGKQVLGVLLESESDIQTADQPNSHEYPVPVPIPIQDTTELAKFLRHNLFDRLWDDVDFQREMRQEKYYFDLCRNWDGKVAVLVVVESELKLLAPKALLGMMAVNVKMPGFVNFSLLKSTFSEQRQRKKAMNEAKLRLKAFSHGQSRRSSTLVS